MLREDLNLRLPRFYLQTAVVIAMVAVHMVQVSIDDVVRVPGVRNRIVAAILPVFVTSRVGTASVAGRALIGIGRVHSQPVIIDVGAVRCDASVLHPISRCVQCASQPCAHIAPRACEREPPCACGGRIPC